MEELSGTSSEDESPEVSAGDHDIGAYLLNHRRRTGAQSLCLPIMAHCIAD